MALIHTYYMHAGLNLVAMGPTHKRVDPLSQRSSRDINATPGCTFYPTDPEKSPTPSRVTLLKNNDTAPCRRKPQIRNRRYPETSIKPPHASNKQHITFFLRVAINMIARNTRIKFGSRRIVDIHFPDQGRMTRYTFVRVRIFTRCCKTITVRVFPK